MISDSIKPGLSRELSLRVDEALTNPALAGYYPAFTGMPAVFASSFLVGLIESACIDVLQPHLRDNQLSIGVHLDLVQSGMTPIGHTVRAAISLIRITGHRLRFKVACRDDRQIIAEGHHDRAILDGGLIKAIYHGKPGARVRSAYT